MESIFKALRALRRNHADLLLGNKEAEGLQAALFRFDRTNRGHQHLLGELSRAAIKQYPPSDKDDVFRTRWWGFRYSMQDLMLALPSTPKAAIPWQGDFQALWNAKDDSGCLEHFALQSMQQFLWTPGSGIPEALRLQGVSLELQGGRLQLAVALQHQKHPSLQATLRLAMECDRLDSLGACAIAIREYRRKTKELLSKADALPEFSVERKEAVTGTACKERMREMLAKCSKEELDWFAKNWPQLRPAAMASSATL